MDLPWYEPRIATAPLRDVYLRANLMAASTDSAPLLFRCIPVSPAGATPASASKNASRERLYSEPCTVMTPARLLADGLDHPWVAVAHYGHAVSAHHVYVFPAGLVPHPGPPGPVHHHGELLVQVSGVLVLTHR